MLRLRKDHVKNEVMVKARGKYKSHAVLSERNGGDSHMNKPGMEGRDKTEVLWAILKNFAFIQNSLDIQ